VRDCVTMPPITHYALFGALVSKYTFIGISVCLQASQKAEFRE
jgi:hypothetical protein